MVVLGTNKQLDLQTLFTQVLRDRAQAQGWYDDRREYQLDFIVVTLVAGAVAATALALFLRKVIGRVIDALIGLAVLVLFVVIRAASFHYVDSVIYRGTVHLNWVLEIGGIAIVGLAAARADVAVRRRLGDRRPERAFAAASPVQPAQVETTS